MNFNFKTVIEDYCGTGKLSKEEVDSLERQHIKTMSSIRETSSPTIAHWNICEACNLKQKAWISSNALILIRLGLLRQEARAHKLFDALCLYKLLN